MEGVGEDGRVRERLCGVCGWETGVGREDARVDDVEMQMRYMQHQRQRKQVVRLLLRYIPNKQQPASVTPRTSMHKCNGERGRERACVRCE